MFSHLKISSSVQWCWSKPQCFSLIHRTHMAAMGFWPNLGTGWVFLGEFSHHPMVPKSCIVISWYVLLFFMVNLWQSKKKTHLVGGIPTPLNNMRKSVGVTIPNIWENKIHVPNHQPVILYCFAGWVRFIEKPIQSGMWCPILNGWKTHPMVGKVPLTITLLVNHFDSIYIYI